MKTIYLLLFVITFSWCAPRECTSDEAKSIGCKVTKPYIENGTKVQYLCFVDAEEYVDGSSKNIPHCITTYPRTWTVDTKPFPLFSSLAQDHFHGYISNGFKSLKTAVDDHSSVGLKQRVINGKPNIRVNGDMATTGATVMIQRDGEYNFDPSPTNNKSSVYSEKIFKNDGGFSASNFTQCRSDFIYDPNKLGYCQNSASSTFDFSEKNAFIQNNLTGKNIVYARLYWGGSIYQNWKFKNEVAADFISNALNFIKGYSRIDFKVPGKEQAITIDAKPEDIFSPRGDDCVKKYKKPAFDPNNPADDPDGIGRVSCDIELKKEGNVTFQFIPEDMQISNLKIIKDDAVTYLDNDGMQKVKLCFDVTAKLSDTLKNLHPELYGDYRYLDEKYLPAKFYVDACYANEANFELKLHKVPLNFTDNNGNVGTLEKANEEILFFEVLGSNTKKLTDSNAKKGMFYIKKSAFEEGKASAEVYFNFARKVNHAKNPFTVSSDDFSLDNLDTIINSKSYKYESPAKKTSANFYYGRVYAPYYEGPADGFFAKIYYGIYCDDCDKATYLTSGTGTWQAFPAATSWYVNPSHEAGVLKFDDFSFSNNTVLGNNVSAVNNGEQLIFVSNQKPVKDIAKMHANMWLIYNEFNKDAVTNDFTLKFLVPDGNWAGKTLKEGSEKGDVGNVVGAEGNFKDLSKKTNRRISW